MVRMKNQGFTLVSVLITSTIAMITGAALLKMIRVYAAAERGVASNAELEHFASTLSSILERKESCEKSGLVGLTLDPDSVTATASPIAIHRPGLNGPGSVFAAKGKPIGNTRILAKLQFSSLTPVRPVTLGTEYFATLRYQTVIRGKAMTSRNPSGEIFLVLTLDSNNKVVECSGTQNDSAVSGSCPSGQSMTGIDSDGNIICGTPTTPPAPTVTCNPKYVSCIKKPRYLVATGNLKIFPNSVHCSGDSSGSYAFVHAYGTATCPSGWRPAGGGGHCEFTGNTWEAGVDVFGAPTGGGWTLQSNMTANAQSWFVDCCVIIRKELVTNGQLYNGYQPAAGKGAVQVSCVPET